MKKIKIIIALLLFLLAFDSYSQTNELVYIRIQENIKGNGVSSYMRITYPDKPSKFVDLETLGNGGKSSEGNGKMIHNELTVLINEKYEIISCSVGSDVFMSTTIIVLSRQK